MKNAVVLFLRLISEQAIVALCFLKKKKCSYTFGSFSEIDLRGQGWTCSDMMHCKDLFPEAA